MMGLREHEKFWAFIVLIGSIVAMALIARFSQEGGEHSSAIRDAIIGLIGIAGAAGQSLFRTSTAEGNLAEAARINAEKQPQPTQKVEIEQPADKAVPIKDTTPEEDGSWMRS